jgi:sensor histidine kinase YesM
LWKEGTIDGPPRSRSDLSKLRALPDFKSWEVSPLGNPASRSSISSLLEKQDSDNEPSRIILEIADTPSPALLEYIDRNKYELNREFPDQDLIKKALQGIFAGVIGIGILLSLLSIATFATSFKLVVSQSSEHVKNLLLLGFSPGQISQIFYRRFQKLFIYIISGSFVVCLLSKYFVGQTAIEFGINIESILSGYTVVFAVLYSIVFLVVNKTNISNSVLKLDK